MDNALLQFRKRMIEMRKSPHGGSGYRADSLGLASVLFKAFVAWVWGDAIG